MQKGVESMYPMLSARGVANRAIVTALERNIVTSLEGNVGALSFPAGRDI